jgi:DNA repair protein RecO (recombination protein O)
LEEFEGLILKQINFKESSKILYLYTANGPMSLLVHGAKKLSSPFLNVTQNMTLIRFFASGKAMKTLTDAEIVEDYRKLKENLEKFTYMQHVMETLHFFSETEYAHKKMYDFLKKIFKKVESETNYIRYIYMFELKFLYLLGFTPSFSVCAACGKDEMLKFSVQDGGFVCLEHATAPYFWDLPVVDAMKSLFYHDLKNPLELKIDDETLKGIRQFLDEYYMFHLNFKSKSRSILSGLLGY